MKMRNYMKKREERVDVEAMLNEEELVYQRPLFNKKKLLVGLFSLLVAVPTVLAVMAHKELKSVSLGEEGTIQLSIAPIAATSEKKGVIAIPAGTVKANPFLPYRDLGNTVLPPDVPAFTLVEPPEMVNENSDAARVMDTIVSGILYDKYNPSAILNIEGNDYLVKKGDTVNNYKVVSILQDSVTVKLGENVYKAGIGEILTEGTLNHNDVSNLKNKFGGVQ